MDSKKQPNNDEIPLQSLNGSSKKHKDAGDIAIDIEAIDVREQNLIPSDPTPGTSGNEENLSPAGTSTIAVSESFTTTGSDTSKTGVSGTPNTPTTETNLTGFAWFRRLMSSKIERAKGYQFRIRFERYRAVKGTPFEMLSVIPTGRSPARIIPMGIIPEESSSSGGVVVSTTEALCHQPPSDKSKTPGENISISPDPNVRTRKNDNVPTNETRQDDIIEVASIRKSSTNSGIINPDALTCRGVYFGKRKPEPYTLDCSKAVTCCECAGYRCHDDTDNDDNNRPSPKCCEPINDWCDFYVSPVFEILFGHATFNNYCVYMFFILFLGTIIGLLMKLLFSTLHTQEVVNLAFESNSTKFRRF